jgi:hypothetical protein
MLMLNMLGRMIRMPPSIPLPLCFLSTPVLFGSPQSPPRVSLFPFPHRKNFLFNDSHQKKIRDPIWPRKKSHQQESSSISLPPFEPKKLLCHPRPEVDELPRPSIKAHTPKHIRAHQSPSSELVKARQISQTQEPSLPHPPSPSRP